MTALDRWSSRPFVHELLARRWSPCSIDPNRPVSRLAVLTLLEAARIAPSCFNEQPWRFLVFDADDPEALQRARGCLIPGNSWAQQAPVLILTAAAERWEKDGCPNRHAQHDVGLASENLALQATSLGLAVHFMAGFDNARARQIFHIPEEFTLMAMVAIGYPAETEMLPEKLRARELAPRQRRPIDEIAFRGRWLHPFEGRAADPGGRDATI
jgi:nitroreductase